MTMLRDALRGVCIDGGWTYAVFWRIVECGNTRHLIWEDGHHELCRTSSLSSVPGLPAAFSLLEEWGVVQDDCDDGTEGNRLQVENRVGLLLEKIMKPKVHHGGCGIIGSAALTGDHQWLLQNEICTEGYTSRGLEEIKDQFSAGIQTIAVIPVLPYGVVQLGSSQMLGLVPGALFSDSSMKESLHQKVQSHMLPDLTISPEVSERTVTKMGKLITSISDICGPQGSKAPASSPLNSTSGAEIYEKSPNFVDLQLGSRLIFKATNEPLNEIQQPRVHAAAKSEHFFNVKQEGQSGTTFGLSNADMIPDQHPNFTNIEFVDQNCPSMIDSEFDSSNLIFLKQQMCGIGPQQSGSGSQTLGVAMNTNMPSQVHPVSHKFRGSTNRSSFGINESPLSSNVIGTGNFGFYPSTTDTRSAIDIKNMGSSFMTGHGDSSNMNCPNNNHLASVVVTSVNAASPDICFPSASAPNKWKMDCSSKAPAFPTSSSNSSVSRTHSSLESFNGCLGSQDFQSNRRNSLIIDKQQATDNKDLHNPVHTISKENSCLSLVYASSDDLYDALGLDVKPRHSAGKLDAPFSSLMDTNASKNLDADPVLDVPYFGISCGEIFSDLGDDQLLDAVVSKVNSNAIHGSNDNVSCNTTLINISQPAVGDIPSHTCPLDSSGNMPLGASPPLGMVNAGSLLGSSCSLSKAGDVSHREGDYKSQIRLWTENHQSLKNDSTSSSNCKKIDETSRLHKKRLKPGENPRPRPKDRQMIQDRVKELREIVPNGAKCSIDALLERTIKHMLFLQSVTRHADKLKETGEPKITNRGGLLLKDNFEGGATWAFEIGSESMICPIIVEDLNPPRQLLVEMLCEDRGFFLEIADLIKGLGLTILKGVIELRNAKVWARFAVEANRDVTRMDIFLSLVRLLESSATGVGSPQGLRSIVNLEHNMFCQSSLPTTVGVDQLQ